VNSHVIGDVAGWRYLFKARSFLRSLLNRTIRYIVVIYTIVFVCACLGGASGDVDVHAVT